jgi:hypothetical protein
MLVKKMLAAAGLLTLVGGVAACGGSSSSATGAAGAPTGVSTSDFCATFTNLSSATTPKQLADKLQSVGTPSDIATNERHGFEILVDKLETLPDDAKASDLSSMEQGLSATDLADVTAFTTYLTTACVPSAGSTPSSPSS